MMELKGPFQPEDFIIVQDSWKCEQLILLTEGLLPKSII